ncbi:MAG: DUF4369 domain-containing protein [Prevotella sp.]|nr:DUF4369 domain-containing protein [Prevotella sp.]
MNKTFSRIKKYSAIAVSALAMVACNQNKFHVSGNITEAKDSILYFENMSLDGPVVIDSVKLGEDGAFDFSDAAKGAPEFYRLRIASNIINVSIDSTETVTFKASYPTMAVKYEVEGSENCAKIKELSLLQIQLLNQAIAIDRNNTLSMQQSADSINSLVEAYKQNVKTNYIFKEPNKAYAYFALFQALGNRLIFNPRASKEDAQVFGAVATSWDTYYPDAERGLNLHNIAIEGLKTQRIIEANKVGPMIDASKVNVANIIDIPLIDNKGRKRSLTELTGKVVLLDFHAFSMERSTERIMMLRDLYNKYHAQGFEIYQVGLDGDEHFWKTKTAALPWISVYDPKSIESEYISRYNVQSIPTFFLIDKTNSLYKRDAQIKDIDAEIKSLL